MFTINVDVKSGYNVEIVVGCMSVFIPNYLLILVIFYYSIHLLKSTEINSKCFYVCMFLLFQ